MSVKDNVFRSSCQHGVLYSSRAYLCSLFMVVLGVVLTAFAFRQFSTREKAKYLEAILLTSQQLADTLRSSLLVATYSASYLMDSVVTIEDWRVRDFAFAKAAVSISRDSSLINFCTLSQYVRHEDRDDWERNITAQAGLPVGAIQISKYLPSGSFVRQDDSDYYLPLRIPMAVTIPEGSTIDDAYFSSNIRAAGFDVLSEKFRRETVETVLMTKQMTMSPQLHSVIDHSTMFSTYFPMFSHTNSSCYLNLDGCKVDEKSFNRELEGITLCTLSFENLLRRMVNTSTDIDALVMEDITSSPEGRQILFSLSRRNHFTTSDPQRASVSDLDWSSLGVEYVSPLKVVNYRDFQYHGFPVHIVFGDPSINFYTHSGVDIDSYEDIPDRAEKYNYTLNNLSRIVEETLDVSEHLVQSVAVSVGGRVLVLHMFLKTDMWREYPLVAITALIIGLLLSLLVAALSFLSIRTYYQIIVSNQRKIRHFAELADISRETHAVTMGYATHQLRNPLHRLIGTLNLLEDGATNLHPDQKRDLQTISNCVSEISRLLSDITDLTGLQSGKIPLSIEEFAIRPVTQIAIYSISSSQISHSHPISIQYNIAKNVPNSFFSDPVRISQLLVIALTNACQHGVPLPPRAGALVAAATDSPELLPPDLRSILFASRSRLNESTTPAFGAYNANMASPFLILDLVAAGNLGGTRIVPPSRSSGDVFVDVSVRRVPMRAVRRVAAEPLHQDLGLTVETEASVSNMPTVAETRDALVFRVVNISSRGLGGRSEEQLFHPFTSYAMAGLVNSRGDNGVAVAPTGSDDAPRLDASSHSLGFEAGGEGIRRRSSRNIRTRTLNSFRKLSRVFQREKRTDDDDELSVDEFVESPRHLRPSPPVSDGVRAGSATTSRPYDVTGICGVDASPLGLDSDRKLNLSVVGGSAAAPRSLHDLAGASIPSSPVITINFGKHVDIPLRDEPGSFSNHAGSASPDTTWPGPLTASRDNRLHHSQSGSLDFPHSSAQFFESFGRTQSVVDVPPTLFSQQHALSSQGTSLSRHGSGSAHTSGHHNGGSISSIMSTSNGLAINVPIPPSSLLSAQPTGKNSPSKLPPPAALGGSLLRAITPMIGGRSRSATTDRVHPLLIRANTGNSLIGSTTPAASMLGASSLEHSSSGRKSSRLRRRKKGLENMQNSANSKFRSDIARRAQGVGLGLPLAKIIVDRLGGLLRIWDEPIPAMFLEEPTPRPQTKVPLVSPAPAEKESRFSRGFSRMQSRDKDKRTASRDEEGGRDKEKDSGRDKDSVSTSVHSVQPTLGLEPSNLQVYPPGLRGGTAGGANGQSTSNLNSLPSRTGTSAFFPSTLGNPLSSPSDPLHHAFSASPSTTHAPSSLSPSQSVTHPGPSSAKPSVQNTSASRSARIAPLPLGSGGATNTETAASTQNRRPFGVPHALFRTIIEFAIPLTFSADDQVMLVREENAPDSVSSSSLPRPDTAPGEAGLRSLLAFAQNHMTGAGGVPLSDAEASLVAATAAALERELAVDPTALLPPTSPTLASTPGPSSAEAPPSGICGGIQAEPLVGIYRFINDGSENSSASGPRTLHTLGMQGSTANTPTGLAMSGGQILTGFSSSHIGYSSGKDEEAALPNTGRDTTASPAPGSSWIGRMSRSDSASRPAYPHPLRNSAALPTSPTESNGEGTTFSPLNAPTSSQTTPLTAPLPLVAGSIPAGLATTIPDDSLVFSPVSHPHSLAVGFRSHSSLSRSISKRVEVSGTSDSAMASTPVSGDVKLFSNLLDGAPLVTRPKAIPNASANTAATASSSIITKAPTPGPSVPNTRAGQRQGASQVTFAGHFSYNLPPSSAATGPHRTTRDPQIEVLSVEPFEPPPRELNPRLLPLIVQSGLKLDQFNIATSLVDAQANEATSVSTPAHLVSKVSGELSSSAQSSMVDLTVHPPSTTFVDTPPVTVTSPFHILSSGNGSPTNISSVSKVSAGNSSQGPALASLRDQMPSSKLNDAQPSEPSAHSGSAHVLSSFQQSDAGVSSTRELKANISSPIVETPLHLSSPSFPLSASLRSLSVVPTGLDSQSANYPPCSSTITSPAVRTSYSGSIPPHMNPSLVCKSAPLPTPCTSTRQALGLHILHVDDEEPNRRLMNRMLARLGCTSDALEDGDEMVARLRETGQIAPLPGQLPTRRPYDLIFLDIVMERSDGAEICQMLVKDYGITVPIIAATGNAEAGLVERFGFADVVDKPFSLDKLFSVTKKNMRKL